MPHCVAQYTPTPTFRDNVQLRRYPRNAEVETNVKTTHCIVKKNCLPTSICFVWERMKFLGFSFFFWTFRRNSEGPRRENSTKARVSYVVWCRQPDCCSHVVTFTPFFQWNSNIRKNDQSVFVLCSFTFAGIIRRRLSFTYKTMEIN